MLPLILSGDRVSLLIKSWVEERLEWVGKPFFLLGFTSFAQIGTMMAQTLDQQRFRLLAFLTALQQLHIFRDQETVTLAVRYLEKRTS